MLVGSGVVLVLGSGVVLAGSGVVLVGSGVVVCSGVVLLLVVTRHPFGPAASGTVGTHA